MRPCLSIALLFATSTYSVALPGLRNHWSDPYSLRPNPLYPYVRSPVVNISTRGYASRFWKDSGFSPSRTRRSTKNLKLRAGSLQPRQDAPTTTEQDLDTRPTPDPTGLPSIQTTVFIASEKDFALLLPKNPGGMFEFCEGARRDQRFVSELVSDAEMDAVTYCSPGSSSDLCENRMPDGLITAASVTRAEDDSWIQVTGCFDSSKFHFASGDAGGQMDVRFPNGAQCTFGVSGASFIELVEPALNRFCLRCCSKPNDQVHCNSHRDRTGCETAIPGTYNFPDLGINCE